MPAGTTAAANGLPLGKLTHRGRTTWVFLQRQPMATELVQIAVGRYDETVNGRIPGVFSRDVTSPSLTAMMRPILALQPAHMDWMEDRVGRYPFDAYGALVVDAELGFALETQTLSLYDKLWFTAYTQDTWDPTMVHELAHAWFGNSVSPYEWSDLWLNEGHASWYEFVYAEENGFLEGDTENYPDPTGYATLVELMKAVYAHGDEWRAEAGPVARPFVGDAEHALPPQRLPRRRARALRAAPEGRQCRLRPHRARVRRPLPRPLDRHRRLHRARGPVLRPPRRGPLPARLGLRHQDAADAGSPGLDHQPAGQRAGQGRPAARPPAPLSRPYNAL